ncbi:ABC transporter ATP-binding protein [Cohnella caldifontis]|uniref:ABC transporter ATP-binding protein n=1 Tax=Cohnella caldifontis TaxID=3027471 RepID=UPI0023EC702C|nr:ABC transporter ATP-binding protein [Cohnella sp. YIM B05605]
MLHVEGIRKTYGETSVLTGVGFTVRRGECFGILGPNGSGKSTLLKLISGVEKPDAGAIELDGKPLSAYSRKQLSRLLAVLQQEALPPVGFTVREVIEMGRHPYRNWMGEEAPETGAIVDAIIDKLGLTRLQDRSLHVLSGGERQRAALGKAMAQQPRLLLLDEPTTYLDIGYQVQMMDRIKAWQREQELTVIAVLHDLNLAALYCDRMLLLKGGVVRAIGTAEDILREELIREVYGTSPVLVRHPEHRVPQIMLRQGGTRDE